MRFCFFHWFKERAYRPERWTSSSSANSFFNFYKCRSLFLTFFRL